MAIRLASSLHLSGSTRLILAIWRLIADFQSDIGKAVLSILKKQFPGQDPGSSASEIGRKMQMIAQHELQKNPQDAQDSIMDFLTYLTTGSKYEMNEDGSVVYEKDPDDPEGKAERKKERSTPSPWNFAKDFKTPKEALQAIYTNLKRRSIDKSKTKSRRRKQEESVDEAFGTRGEGGGPSEGGEARTPTPDASALGKALDDKAATKQFIEVLDKHVNDLRESLPLDQQMLFDLVFTDEIGSFGTDVKQNMNQATAFEEKLNGPDATPEMKEIYKKNAKRWSAFVTTLRSKLLENIRSFIEEQLPQQDVDVLWSEFFSDTTPEAVARKEQETAQGKAQDQTDKDKRKLGRLKWKQNNGETLTEAEEKDFARLSDKLKKLGEDPDKVEALHPDMKGRKLKKTGVSFDLALSDYLSRSTITPMWMSP